MPISYMFLVLVSALDAFYVVPISSLSILLMDVVCCVKNSMSVMCGLFPLTCEITTLCSANGLGLVVFNISSSS